MINFISGLPRSGSTLLVAILKQNPKFTVNISSPLADLFIACDAGCSKESSVFINQEQRLDILRGLFNSYYKKTSNIIFDTHRFWNSRIHILSELFPEAKFISCVREVGWVADSFEKLYRKNNQQASALYGWTTGGNVFNRTRHLLEKDNVIGFSLNSTIEAVNSKQIKLIDYELLCRFPEEVIRSLYEYIEEDYFGHHFSSIEYSTDEFDLKLGSPGLHKIQGPIEWKPRQTILPLELFNEANQGNFWR